METLKRDPSDVRDEEWAFVVSYLTLLPVDAEHRTHDLREVCHALRWLVRSGAPWRILSNDLPPCYTVCQQAQRWLKAGCFEAIVHDLRTMLCLAAGRTAEPMAVILESRTLQSTPERSA